MASSFCPQQKQGMADLGYLPSFWRFIFSDIPMYQCCFLFLINSFAISAVHCLAAPHDAAIQTSNFSSLNLTAVHSSVPSSSSLAMPEKAYVGANDVGRRRQFRDLDDAFLRVGFILGEEPFAYGTPMEVGTPPQAVTLKLDMGEINTVKIAALQDDVPLITFPCSLQLVPKGRPFFEFRNSSSFTEFPCNALNCPIKNDIYCAHAIQFAYYLKPNCSITKYYSNAVKYKGDVVYEQLGLWTTAGLRSLYFLIACLRTGLYYTSDRMPPLTGSLLLGRGNFSFNSQLTVAIGEDNAFSFCFLEHRPSTLHKTSNMVFGRAALFYRRQAGMKKIADISDPTRYFVKIKQLKIDGNNFDYNGTDENVLTTRSPLTYFPLPIFVQIKVLLILHVKLQRYPIVRRIENPALLCLRTPNVALPDLQLPPLSVMFGYENNDVEITVPVQNYFYLLEDNLTACLALAPSLDNSITLGVPFFQNMRVVVYDKPKEEGGGVFMGYEECQAN